MIPEGAADYSLFLREEGGMNIHVPVNMAIKSVSERENISTSTSSDMRSLIGSRKAALSVVGAVWTERAVEKRAQSSTILEIHCGAMMDAEPSCCLQRAIKSSMQRRPEPLPAVRRCTGSC